MAFKNSMRACATSGLAAVIATIGSVGYAQAQSHWLDEPVPQRQEMPTQRIQAPTHVPKADFYATNVVVRYDQRTGNIIDFNVDAIGDADNAATKNMIVHMGFGTYANRKSGPQTNNNALFINNWSGNVDEGRNLSPTFQGNLDVSFKTSSYAKGYSQDNTAFVIQRSPSVKNPTAGKPVGVDEFHVIGEDISMTFVDQDNRPIASPNDRMRSIKDFAGNYGILMTGFYVDAQEQRDLNGENQQSLYPVKIRLNQPKSGFGDKPQY